MLELQDRTRKDRAERKQALSGGTGGNSPGVELQPNKEAPLLRTDKHRRNWIERELDNCNQVFEYQRVLDGEIAQRAEAARCGGAG